jgi:uncharacterized membrane protein
MSNPMNNESSAPAVVRHSRTTVLISFYALLFSFVLRALWQIAQGMPVIVGVIICLVQTAPLLIFLPGLRRRHLRTYAWLSFASMLYFIPAVLTAFTPGVLLYGLWLTLLCTVLFCALVSYIHFARKLSGESLQS